MNQINSNENQCKARVATISTLNSRIFLQTASSSLSMESANAGLQICFGELAASTLFCPDLTPEALATLASSGSAADLEDRTLLLLRVSC